MLVARGMHSACIVQDLLGEGGQAEVYRVRIGDMEYALKWYRKEYLPVDRRLWERLKTSISAGSPTDRFFFGHLISVSLPQASEYGGYLQCRYGRRSLLAWWTSSTGRRSRRFDR